MTRNKNEDDLYPSVTTALKVVTDDVQDLLFNIATEVKNAEPDSRSEEFKLGYFLGREHTVSAMIKALSKYGIAGETLDKFVKIAIGIDKSDPVRELDNEKLV